MRVLKPSERRLALAFIGIVFIAANFLALEHLAETRASLQTNIHDLEIKKSEAAFWMSQKQLWSERKTWLDQHQPTVKGSGQESSELLQTLQQSARGQDINITQQSIAGEKTTPYYREVAVQLEVKGSFQSICQWLAALQQPESFLAITNLNLKSDEQPPAMICQLTVARWLALP